MTISTIIFFTMWVHIVVVVVVVVEFGDEHFATADSEEQANMHRIIVEVEVVVVVGVVKGAISVVMGGIRGAAVTIVVLARGSIATIVALVATYRN